MCGGSLFGSSVKTPEVQKVAPAPTQVTTSDTGTSGTADSDAARRERLKKGYASTRLSQDRNTILSGASGRSKLG